MPRQKLRSAGSCVAHYDGVRPHRNQSVQSIDERFTLRHTGALRCNGNSIRTQSFQPVDTENSSSWSIFEEQIHDHLSAKRIQAAERTIFDRLKKMCPVQYRIYLSAVQALDIEQSGRLCGHGLHSLSGLIGDSLDEKYLLHIIDFLKFHLNDLVIRGLDVTADVARFDR